MINNLYSPACEYGCDHQASYQLKNGKWCCHNYIVQCPALRKKNSKANTLEKNHFFGKKHTKEALSAIGLKSIGRKTFLNKHHTEETKEILRIKNTGRHHSEETKEKNRIASTGKKMPPRTEGWCKTQSVYMLNGGSRKANIKKHKVIRDDKDLSFKEIYYDRVWGFTRSSMRKKFTKEELKQRGRNKGRKSLDHLFSIIKGFELGILPSIIGCKSNLELVNCDYNNVKKSKCDITLEELFKRYDEENKTIRN